MSVLTQPKQNFATYGVNYTEILGVSKEDYYE